MEGLKKIAEAFRSARKIELVLAAVLIAVMVLLLLGQHDAAISAPGGVEQRLEKLLCSIEGAGKVEVMLSGEESAYTGCVVIAEGADDVHVALKMQRAIQAALGILPENVEIIASGG